MNKEYPVYFVRNIMKSEANLSFKQVKPRPNNIDLDRIKYIRLLF